MRKALFWLFVVAVAAVFLRVGLREESPPTHRDTAARPSQADPSQGVRGAGYMAAKKVLPAALKFPSEAEYPWDSVSAKHLGGDQWEVTGVVIGKNSFGVKGEMQYVVTVSDHGENLFATKVTLDGETVFSIDRK